LLTGISFGFRTIFLSYSSSSYFLIDFFGLGVFGFGVFGFGVHELGDFDLVLEGVLGFGVFGLVLLIRSLEGLAAGVLDLLVGLLGLPDFGVDVYPPDFGALEDLTVPDLPDLGDLELALDPGRDPCFSSKVLAS
jgi:hypothetical protein